MGLPEFQKPVDRHAIRPPGSTQGSGRATRKPADHAGLTARGPDGPIPEGSPKVRPDPPEGGRLNPGRKDPPGHYQGAEVSTH